MQMDSFNFYNIKVEKANAKLKHRQLQKIANLFRVIEVCVVLLLISRLSMQLPLAVKNSGGYFRNLTVVLASPGFVFFVGNAIVITLFAKSGRKTPGFDLCEEIIKNTEKNQKVHPDETTWYLHKHTTYEESTVKDYRRTQSYSQSSTNRVCEKSRRVLRHQQTEICRNSSRSCEELAKSSYPEDEMSNEEFKRKVEAFIARQQRFRREEEDSVL